MNRIRDMTDTCNAGLFVAKAAFLSYAGYYLFVTWSLSAGLMRYAPSDNPDSKFISIEILRTVDLRSFGSFLDYRCARASVPRTADPSGPVMEGVGLA
jgi:hypothetical protein